MYLFIFRSTSFKQSIISSFIYQYENSVYTGKSSCSGYECLKQYVEKPDSNYAWNDNGIRINGFDPWHLKTWTGYVLNFTSQQWLTPQDSSRSIWWHTLVVIIPGDVQYPNTPFLWIAGGSNDNDDIPGPTDEDLIIAGSLCRGN